ncbi:MAG TPA: sigma-70 family RNA polymerase sigma factor [Phycisphaerae bacterium]|nr:sigma-70 family RNA polymerase sigma factor [Phycisphaerae bacterium]
MASSGQTSSGTGPSGDGEATDRPGRSAVGPRASEARFAATRWSVVLTAAGRDAAGRSPAGGAASASRRALEELVGAYWFPLYAFLRRQGNRPDQAEDLTQGFFAHLLENAGLATVDPSRGRFRSFLLAGLKHYAADQRDKALAAKRGGRRRAIPLDTAEAEAHYSRALADTMTPERVFERSWAIAVLNQVVLRLERQYAAKGKAAEFAALRHCLDGQTEGQSHAAMAAALGLTEAAVRVRAHRLRRRYRDLLREEIAQIVADPSLVDDELRYLLSCL